MILQYSKSNIIRIWLYWSWRISWRPSWWIPAWWGCHPGDLRSTSRVWMSSPAMGRGIDSRNRVWNWVAKLHRLAGRYDNPMPTWFLYPPHTIAGLKRTVSRDFLLLVFLWISFPPALECPIRTVSNFFQKSRRYSQLKVDHRCRWHHWQMKKIFNQKNFINFVGTPLDSRVNIYINFCLQVHFKVFSAWY